jgi:multidrug efflux system outer membrane protein
VSKSRIFMLCLSISLASCTLIPAYESPSPALPQKWQAALPHDGSTARLQDWWKQFDDPLLLELLASAERDHPTLEKAAAAIREARATVTINRAAGLPAVDGAASATRSSSNDLQRTPAATTRTAGIDASWELDLFGAVRYSTDAARARAEARTSDWHNARISLAAEVASNYVSYRACELQVRAYQDELASQRETARVTRELVNAGFTAPADGRLAEANVATATANTVAQQESCDLTVKALVALTGLEEPQLRSKLASGTEAIPAPQRLDVAAIPVARLSQRPDVMSAERSLAASYAEIGSAEADRYPRLSLLGSITLTALSGASATTWSFGPSLTAPLFDAGKRKAAVTAAEARYEQALASYRQSVRDAVQETEQALVRLDSATQRETEAVKAADNYRAYLASSETLWKSGGMSLLDLETARRSAITAELNVIALKRDQVSYWIALYKALGGDWESVPAPMSSTPLSSVTGTP